MPLNDKTTMRRQRVGGLSPDVARVRPPQLRTLERTNDVTSDYGVSELSVTEARDYLADFVNRVAYSGEGLTLTRTGPSVLRSKVKAGWSTSAWTP